MTRRKLNNLRVWSMLALFFRSFPLQWLYRLGDFVLFVLKTLRVLILHFPRWHLVREQLYQVGVLSLPVVAMTGLSTGLVLAVQSFYQLSDKGLAGATGLMVGKAMITELGPVLTAFMVTGRVGAAMCAELGTMCVTEQVDALKTMAVNLYRYLIAPRFLAGILMMPLLTIFSVCMGIFGGYLISVLYFHLSPNTYFDPMPTYITYFDLMTGLIKASLFGFFIATIACYKGVSTEGGARGVGQATTKSVVICYTCILFSNFLVTLGLNLLKSVLGWFT
ncbi:MAG: ABC transporter permease [Chlamydiota bacterium]|nr:ABC transporter permease [Chlamydiota bacterium]